MDWDVFISHATEDKDSFARPLAQALEAKGLRVWFDEVTLTVGDSLRRSIDNGLANARYGIVILSPSFFAKEWPQKELDGLMSRELHGEKVILPIWHNIGRDEVGRYSPLLADRFAIPSRLGMDRVVSDLLQVINREIVDEFSSPFPHVSTVSRVDEFSLSAHLGDDPFLESARENISELHRALSSVSIRQIRLRDKRAMQQLMTADQRILFLCQELYPTKISVSDGMDKWVERENQPTLPINIIPVPFNNRNLKEIISWVALYSQLTVLVTDDSIRDFERITQNDTTRWQIPERAERILALNKQYDNIVSKGLVVFLPRSNSYEEMRTRESITTECIAPLHQPPDQLFYSPLNYGKARLTSVDEYLIYKTLLIPHFRQISIQTAIDIATNETDAFVRFNYVLKDRLKQLSTLDSADKMKLILEEIDYEVAKLNIEAKRISRIKTLSAASLGMVAISLSIMVLANPDWLRTVAGINTGIGVMEFFKIYSQSLNADAEMRKSNYFIPFLLKKRSETSK